MSPILISDTGSIVIVSPPRIVGRMLAPSARKRTRQPRLKSSVTTSTNGLDPGTLFMRVLSARTRAPAHRARMQFTAEDHLAHVLKERQHIVKCRGDVKRHKTRGHQAGPPPRSSTPDP